MALVADIIEFPGRIAIFGHWKRNIIFWEGEWHFIAARERMCPFPKNPLNSSLKEVAQVFCLKKSEKRVWKICIYQCSTAVCVNFSRRKLLDILNICFCHEDRKKIKDSEKRLQKRQKHKTSFENKEIIVNKFPFGCKLRDQVTLEQKKERIFIMKKNHILNDTLCLYTYLYIYNKKLNKIKWKRTNFVA